MKTILEHVEDFMDVWKTLATNSDRRILFAVVERPRRWSDLMFDLRLNPRTLSESLKRLKKRGLVMKVEQSTDPTKYTYTLAARDIARGDFFREFAKELDRGRK